ncbi:MAG TPA: 2-dehydro-3-deoxygalactonokinase [Planctomycetota bacterium]|nr:2-dehydro-3-deoxygalactonokinase [Planctomycetota bacterium]
MRFLSCDWGTTRFRLRLADGERSGPELVSDLGVGTLAARTKPADRPAAFRKALAAAVRALRRRAGLREDLPVVVSGMAGSSIGWKELPYARLPFRLDGRDAVWEEVAPGVYLVSGIQSGHDILRGEETQALGAAALDGGWADGEATLVLPGTHSKHLRVRRGRVIEFRTFMTGELFDVLGRWSVLRHSVDPEARRRARDFREGVRRGASEPLSAALFGVRARQVLRGTSPEGNASFLSGILVGAEMAELRRVKGPVLVAAEGPLARVYGAAAAALGFGRRLRIFPPARAALLSAAGQAVLLRRIQGRV